jgi:chaperone required for assembly of F1-ATPase
MSEFSFSLPEKGGNMAAAPIFQWLAGSLNVCHGPAAWCRCSRVATHNHVILMREILSEIFADQPIDPTEAARRGARPQLRQRFYDRAHIREGEGSFAVMLDGRLVKTPAYRALAAPSRDLALALTDEWNAQRNVIDPAQMPLTRLANAAIDGVADQPGAVAAEIEKYLGSDLLFYRAETPAGLTERQARAWDPVIDWAHEAFGARFVLAQGVMPVRQRRGAIAAAARAIPQDVWRLAAVATVTSLTGSALLALALLHGRLDADAVWAAAHVDEDWQMAQWGRDEQAIASRAHREAEFKAAASVLRLP